jgi:hypothetical protein
MMMVTNFLEAGKPSRGMRGGAGSLGADRSMNLTRLSSTSFPPYGRTARVKRPKWQPTVGLPCLIGGPEGSLNRIFHWG